MGDKLTLEATLRSMKTAVQKVETANSEEDALRTVAEETAVAEVLTRLENHEETTSDLHEKGISILAEEFRSKYPEFEFNDQSKTYPTGSELSKRLERLQEQMEYQRSRDWKQEYEDGLGPGIFTIECSATSLEGVRDYLNETFSGVSVDVLSYKVWPGETQVDFRLKGSCDVGEFPDFFYIEHRRDLEKLRGER